MGTKQLTLTASHLQSGHDVPSGRRSILKYPLFLSGGGRSADAIMARDWSETPLGPMDDWPQSLRIALGMMLASHFPKAIVWGEALTTFHNDAFLPIIGEKPDAIGRGFDEVWSEIWPDLEPMIQRAYAGEATFIENFPLTIRRHDYPEEAYFTFCYSPIRDETGKVAGMMDTVIETTQTILSQRQLGVVNGELAHRMRNMLTMVTVISNMSLRHARTLEEGRAALSQRLAALGRAQSLLLAEKGSAMDVADLVEHAFAPHACLRDRLILSGGECPLPSKQGLSLSLALNELITNSIKYGALSGAGAVRIDWTQTGPDDPFRFIWTETGVENAHEPERRGFGTRVLMEFVPANFLGEARREFGGDRFVYELIAPLAVVRSAPAPAREATA
ncbi:sensor histidine kinase [Sinirhodobacter populi]|uniref:histidine kinase n=1 Tax=Paenirhodobacter populi TaxID=2306993 RepID=A0A443J589_9RHOB|nr:sensor histidine kinase [Sinirhodobacter populi]